MHSRRAQLDVAGFTLIELLVVIAIIAVLATLGVAAVNVARAKARTARAQADLRSIRNAVALLESDTYKWPNGCEPGEVANPEVNLSTTQAGLILSPVVGDQGSGCEWVQEDLDAWQGPYVDRVTDPWDNPYWFDPDYRAYENCGSQTAHTNAPAVFSFGPNGDGVNAYDCDDIFLELN